MLVIGYTRLEAKHKDQIQVIAIITLKSNNDDASVAPTVGALVIGNKNDR